jgi:four helix bundle protein
VSRAAESIPSNIVEGRASASRKEFAHHLNVSIKSTSEVDYQLELARDYRILPYDVWRRLAREAMEIRKMLTALRQAVLRSIEQADMPGPPRPSLEPTKPEETEPDA